MKLEFANWLQGELDRRYWSQAELARRAEVTRSVISSIINQKSFPGKKACRGIARAFNLPFEEVFRRAGLLPESIEVEDLEYRVIANMISKLDNDHKEEVRKYIEYQLMRQEQERAERVQ